MKRQSRLRWAEIRERLNRAQSGATAGASMDRTAVLRQRAALLAETDRGATRGAAQSVVIFRTASDRFALRLEDLVEVVEQPKISPVPRAPARVAGLMQIRGDVRPVYHLHALLGLTQQAVSQPAFTLLLRGAGREFGINADEIQDIREYGPESRRPAPAGAGRTGWMTDDLAPVLAADSLLQKEE